VPTKTRYPLIVVWPVLDWPVLGEVHHRITRPAPAEAEIEVGDPRIAGWVGVTGRAGVAGRVGGAFVGGALWVGGVL
jgi:hypothetical protein